MPANCLKKNLNTKQCTNTMADCYSTSVINDNDVSFSSCFCLACLPWFKAISYDENVYIHNSFILSMTSVLMDMPFIYNITDHLGDCFRSLETL